MTHCLSAWTELFEALPDGVLVVDERGSILFVNRRLCDLACRDVTGLVGEPLSLLIPEDRRDRHASAVASFVASPTARPMGEGPETVLRTGDGRQVPVSISLAPLPLDGTPTVAIVRDDTERHNNEVELFRRATHDPLTGLANRSLLEDRLAQALDRTARRDTLVTVLFLDLDHFKRVNDTAGHEAGDAVLRAAADALRRTFRPGDTVARVGGDEFVVLCEDAAAEEPARLAERLVEAVESAVGALQPAAGVTASVGITVGVGGEAPQRVVARADSAMYVAKRAGGGRWSVADVSVATLSDA